MKKLTIKQSRVCDILQSAGLPGRLKKSDRDLIRKHHKQIPGLIRRKNPHKPAKNGVSYWYQYETERELTVAQAEKEIAIKIGELIDLNVK